MKAVSKLLLVVILPVLLVNSYLSNEIFIDREQAVAPVEPVVQGVSIEQYRPAQSTEPFAVIIRKPVKISLETSDVLETVLVEPPSAGLTAGLVRSPEYSTRVENGVPVSSYSLPEAAAVEAPVDLAVREALPVKVDPASAEPQEIQLPSAAPAAALPAAEPAVQDQQLEVFASSLTNGQPGQIVGVYVSGVLALPVIQQPAGQAGYVSDQDNTVTQFSATSSYGSIGLLAHNYLSGSRFFNLDENQEVVILHGDGHREIYRVTTIQSYQALNPTSVYSNFINLADPQRTVISANDLFNRIYTVSGQVVFQTCIFANGDPSWGRIFVTAERVE